MHDRFADTVAGQPEETYKSATQATPPTFVLTAPYPFCSSLQWRAAQTVNIRVGVDITAFFRAAVG